jgi:hypothetical protein
MNILRNASLSSRASLDDVGRFYQELTDSHRLFARDASAEEIFWTRYFWFSVLARVTQEITRRSDSGLEQQLFKILEHPLPRCEPDWKRLGEVNALAKKESDAWIAQQSVQPDRREDAAPG